MGVNFRQKSFSQWLHLKPWLYFEPIDLENWRSWLLCTLADFCIKWRLCVSDTLIFYNIKCILFLGKFGLLVPSFPNTLPVGYRFGKASMKILEGIYMESFFFIFFFLSFMTSAARMAHFHIKTLRDSSWLWDYSCASVEQKCLKMPKSGTMYAMMADNKCWVKSMKERAVRWRQSEKPLSKNDIFRRKIHQPVLNRVKN